MPRTGAAMVIGAIAIGALPPMNGFVSEWLVYLGLADAGLTQPGAKGVLALVLVGVVALVGTLTAFTFVRLVGIGVLGEPRSDAARHAHESSSWMTAPTFLLLLGCAAIAVAPLRLLRLFAPVAAIVASGPLPDVPAPVETLGTLNLALAAALAFGGVLLARAAPRAARGPTWDCGYADGSPRVQYTGQSFAQILAYRILPRPLQARVTRAISHDLMPQPGRFATEARDPITRSVYEPFAERVGRRFADLRWVQQGHLHLYLVYILVVVLLALAWTSLRDWSWT
jgi:NADH:ubiquinone oxidoreductase subunit 5 (subunit L)/multisubunit Na+/H+ antiporter MnhA subunit